MQGFLIIYGVLYVMMIFAAILEKMKETKPASILGYIGLFGMGFVTIIYGIVH